MRDTRTGRRCSLLGLVAALRMGDSELLMLALWHDRETVPTVATRA